MPDVSRAFRFKEICEKKRLMEQTRFSKTVKARYTKIKDES